ncbi:hypothetical protein IIA28_06675 [candidate division KSB1 bacterium]|nr:hypothetical protein [candidate division KSB1 bacterium]
MALKHLTDEQIQEYLDGNVSKNSWIADHLKSCGDCEAQIDEYSSLYSALEVEEKIGLSANFADGVVSKITAQASATPGFQIWQIFLAVLGLGVGLAAVYLIGINWVGKLFTGLGEFGKIFSGTLAIISNYFAGINLNFGLLGLAAFALVFMVFLDHFVFQPKQRALSFFR